MKLQKKFFLIFLSISVIPILLVSIYTYSRYIHLVERQTMQSAENLMDVASTSINYTLNTIDHMVESMYLSKDSQVTMADTLKLYGAGASPSPHDLYIHSEKLKSTCQDFIYFTNYINGIFLFTPSGHTLGYGYGNGTSVLTGYDASQEEWYKKTLNLEGETWIYGPSQKKFLENSKESLSFCTSLYDVDTREFLGVLFVDCSTDLFHLAGINTLPNMAVLSVQDNNSLLASSADTGEKSDAAPVLLKRDLNLNGLTLMASLDRKLLYSEFHITQLTLFFLGATCVLVFVVISLLLSRSLTRPIAWLSRQMLLAGGRQDVSSSPYFHSRNEIGVLYNSYQEMLDERSRYVKEHLENKLILMDSQMKALESQINAHFLYNTLEAVNSIASVKKIPEICTMAMALADMFRYSIKTKSELVSLSEELAHVQNFIEIQLIRLGKRFTYLPLIPKELLKKRVLKLILEPLVENALYHGLQYGRQGSQITVTACCTKDILQIHVTDDGVGIAPEKLNQIQGQLEIKAEYTEFGHRDAQSIGVKNIHSRIALYYGACYGLRITSREGEGTRVTVTLPLLSE